MATSASFSGRLGGWLIALRSLTASRVMSFVASVASLMAVVGFINCQPSEPYLTKYLLTVKNISESQLDSVVWPVNTYATLAFLLPIGVMAEVAGYVPVIFVGLAAREATRVILLFCQGLGWMTATQVTYSAAMNVNTIYFSHIYTIFDVAKYQRVTSLVRGAYHFGNVVGSGLGQLMFDYMGADKDMARLFYTSWAFTSAGFAVFVFARPRQRLQRQRPRSDTQSSDNEMDEPTSAFEAAASLQRPLLVHSEQSSEEDAGDLELVQVGDSSNAAEHNMFRVLLRRGLKAFIVEELMPLYTMSEMRMWSTWWALVYGTHIIVGNYYQTLLSHYHHVPYGAIEMAVEVASMVGAVLAMLLAKYSLYGRGTLFVMTGMLAALFGLCLLPLSNPSILYLLHCGIFLLQGCLIALASTRIANCISGHFAAVFTVNTFLALLLVTLSSVIASSLDATTSTYYWICVGMSCLGCLAAVVVR